MERKLAPLGGLLPLGVHLQLFSWKYLRAREQWGPSRRKEYQAYFVSYAVGRRNCSFVFSTCHGWMQILVLISRIWAIENTGFNIFLCLRCVSPALTEPNVRWSHNIHTVCAEEARSKGKSVSTARRCIMVKSQIRSKTYSAKLLVSS